MSSLATSTGTVDFDTCTKGNVTRPEPRLISVVLPVRNVADVVSCQLAALARQTYTEAWELLVVDNGSVDCTLRVVESWAGRLPLRVVDAGHRAGINAARNAGAAAARGDFLVFCDADDRAEPTWLEEMAAMAPRFEVLGGRLDESSLNPSGWRSPRTRLPDDRLPVALGFLPFAPGANLGIWADALAELGGFDERFTLGHDDVELAFRAQLAGQRLGYAPLAVVAYRHRHRPRDMFRQFRSYGRGEVLLYRAYRRMGLRRPPRREVARRWLRLVALAPLAAVSRRRRGSWAIHAGYTTGRLEASWRHRTLFL